MTARRPPLLGSLAPHARPLFLTCLVLVAALSLGSRIAQLRAVLAAPERFFSRGVPVAGTDSYRFFRYAKDYEAGADHDRRDPLRSFPDGREFPELSALAAGMVIVSRWTGLDVYRSGQWITVVGSTLFALPLGLYLFHVGAPLAGIWGAAVGSFGASYLLRTSVHRVDTDGGNLFFLWLVSLCVLGIDPRRGRGRAIAMTAAAGLALNAFCIWYAKPGFAPLYAGTTLLWLLARGSGARASLLLLGVFVLAADPTKLVAGSGDLLEFARRYLAGQGTDPAAVVGPLRFPSVIPEIAELVRLPFQQSLELAAGSAAIGLAGLAGLAHLALRHPAPMLPLLPLLALALLGIASAQRFLMYLGPFLGIGCGWLLTLALRRLWAAVPRLAALPPARSDLLAGLVGVAPLAILLPATTAGRAPEPGIPVELLASLQRIADSLPERSVIAHTWGHGYLVTALTGAATLNDGEDPDPVVEQLLDRGLTDADPAVLHDVVSFLAAHGRAGVDARIAERRSYSGLLESMAGSEPPPDVAVYVLLTEKMLRGFGRTWEKGRWSFEADRGVREGYDVRRCEPEGELLRCAKPGRRDLRVDPLRGLVDGRAGIARFVRVSGGGVAWERSFPQPGGMWMQLVESDDPAPGTLHILKPAVFASNFNQMFVLGRFDPARFRLAFDGFPVARLYEVRATEP